MALARRFSWLSTRLAAPASLSTKLRAPTRSPYRPAHHAHATHARRCEDSGRAASTGDRPLPQEQCRSPLRVGSLGLSRQLSSHSEAAMLEPAPHARAVRPTQVLAVGLGDEHLQAPAQ